MSEKRKDNKGRILKNGETQRKDNIYQYRYTDINGKRVSIYSSDLKKLREKEKKIQVNLTLGLSNVHSTITVLQLAEKYVSLKQGIKDNTKILYNNFLKLISNEAISKVKIQNLKTLDVKMWIINLFNKGYSTASIKIIIAILKPAFSMACEENIIVKNPFSFKLFDVIPNNSKKRSVLTEEQQASLLEFINNDKVYNKYYDMFIVLLETGIRVSEFCGLTINDLDFKKRCIKIDHQLLYNSKNGLYISKPKSESGFRFIPMTNNVYNSLQRIINNRAVPKTEKLINGYAGFLFLNPNGNPVNGVNIDRIFKNIMSKYKKLHPNETMPHVTPHVLRHTFCTNMVNKGMDIKSLQYVMGHANISITLDVYTHSNYERAAEQFKKISEFSPYTKQEKLI